MSEDPREHDVPAEARPDVPTHVLIAEIYFACRYSRLIEDITSEKTERGFAYEGFYVPEDEEEWSEKLRIEIRREPEELDPEGIVPESFGLDWIFRNPRDAVDMLQSFEDQERIGRIPAISSVHYEVYVDDKGFHLDIGLVTFDAAASTEEELADHGMRVSGDGTVEVAEPEKAERLMDALNGLDRFTVEALVHTVRNIEA